jgi:hypothetical protein
MTFGFDGNGFYGDLFDDVEEKKPAAKLTLKKLDESLFYSASHRVQLWVGDSMVVESASTITPMRDSDVQMWARFAVGSNLAKLTWLGVDVKEEFKRFGGDPDDLCML